MRTNIEINDQLMKQAIKASRLETKTKKAVVEEALRLLVKSRAQEGIWKWFGKVQWDGDLRGSRNKDKWDESEKRSLEETAKRKEDALPRSRKKAA